MCVQTELEENKRIRGDFGDLKGSGDWTDQVIITKNGIRDVALGRDGKIRGRKYKQHRLDLAILDDLEDDELVQNPRRVAKLEAFVRSAVFPAVIRRGSTFIIGTVLARNSMLARFLKESAFITRRYSAEENGQSIWPEGMPIEELQKLREIMGTIAYMKEYMNQPRSDEDALIKDEWLIEYEDEEIRDKELKIYTYEDPSAKDKEVHDFKAIITIGIDNDGTIYVLDAFIKRCSIDAVIEQSYNIYERFKPTLFGFEDNAFQSVMLYQFNRWAMLDRKGYNIPCLKPITQKIGKETRAQRLSPLFERGRIKFNLKQGHQRLLWEQCIYFPASNVHDDGLDALMGAIELAELFATGKVEITSAEPRRMPALLENY